jgi:citrate/tricarballylate utilization protein
MSLDTPLFDTPKLAEAARQVQICNACRYCEGYCAVFPAMFKEREFASGDITQLANLCHNCRGCYYACQYTEPHEFALNLPAALAEVRSESWERFAWPPAPAALFHKSGVALAFVLALSIAVMFWLATAFRPTSGTGFYALLSHSSLVAIFAPAFLLPLAAIGIGLRRYWSEVGGAVVRWSHITHASHAAATMRNLSGGQDQGCNFEDEDRFSSARRYAHQATMWGFLLCFASTSSGTVLHYLFDMPAPYGVFSLPKLFGIPGGTLLSGGALYLAWLKTKADPALGTAHHWGGEMAFVLLLAATGITGLALFAATGTPLVTPLLAIHLGAVLTLFLTTPYSKMAHGFYRFAALVRDAQIKSVP